MLSAAMFDLSCSIDVPPRTGMQWLVFCLTHARATAISVAAITKSVDQWTITVGEMNPASNFICDFLQHLADL